MKGSARNLRAVLCGYYGEHNLGDDALLQVLLAEMPSTWRPVVTANDQERVKQQHPQVSTVDRRSLLKTAQAIVQSDALVLGGGSLLQDSTSFKSLLYYLLLIGLARSLGRPVILWGQGLGPLTHFISRTLVRVVLPKVQAIGWRDADSLALAERWNIRVPNVMAADPVWSYPQCSWQGKTCSDKQRRGVVVCWRPTTLLDSKGWKSLLRVVNVVAQQHNLPVTWLAFHQHQDQGLPNHLDQQDLMPNGLMERSSFLVASSLTQVMDVFSCAQLVLPMRLHALILAQLSGAPCVAFSYDPKVTAAAVMAEATCFELAALPSENNMIEACTTQVNKPASLEAVAGLKADALRHGLLLREHLKVPAR